MMKETTSVKKLAALKLFFLERPQQALIKAKMTFDQQRELDILLGEIAAINCLNASLSIKDRNKIFLALSNVDAVPEAGWGLVSNRLETFCQQKDKAKKLFELVERVRMS